MGNDTSARLSLPLIEPGQAQKEMTHNEALALLDLAVAPSVIDLGVDTPPPDPREGECWIVGAAPSGAWTGHGDAVAGWNAGGWRFLAPTEGLLVWVAAAGVSARYANGAWSVGNLPASRIVIDGVTVLAAQQPAIAEPTGGAQIDAECRTTVGAILTALRAHGIVAS